MRCSPEVRAKCPDGRTCEPYAEFREGSWCDEFNARTMKRLDNRHMTRAGRIRAMSDGELADYLRGLYESEGESPFCTMLPECEAALDDPEGDIPEERCHNCMVGWLLGEGDL